MLDMFRKQSTANRLRCDEVLEQLAVEDADLAGAFREALLGDPAEFPAKRIVIVMAEQGWPVSETAVNSWRRRNRG